MSSVFLTVSARESAGLPRMVNPYAPFHQIMACSTTLELTFSNTIAPPLHVAKVDADQPYVGNAARDANASGDARTAVDHLRHE